MDSGLAMLVSASINFGLYLGVFLFVDKIKMNKHQQELKTKILAYEENGTEQKIMNKYLKSINAKEKSAVKKLYSQEYTSKKEFLQLMKIIEIAKAEKAFSIVTPARKKLELDDIFYGICECDEILMNIRKEKEARQKKVDAVVKKSLIDIKRKYQGMSINQLKNTFSR